MHETPVGSWARQAQTVDYYCLVPRYFVLLFCGWPSVPSQVVKEVAGRWQTCG